MYEFDDVLIKPNIDSLDTNTQRIRRNLIATSIVAYIYTVASSGIDTNGSSFAGIKFSNLDTSYIQLLLVISLVYFLLHFIWAAIDHFKENKLRLTGIVIPMVQKGAFFGDTHDLHPNTDQERQSSIFSWWRKEKEKTDGFKQTIETIEENIDKQAHEAALNSINQNLKTINHRASYIEESLARFEKGFWHYQRSQLFRWLILDFSIPVILGLSAIVAVAIGMIQCL